MVDISFCIFASKETLASQLTEEVNRKISNGLKTNMAEKNSLVQLVVAFPGQSNQESNAQLMKAAEALSSCGLEKSSEPFNFRAENGMLTSIDYFVEHLLEKSVDKINGKTIVLKIEGSHELINVPVTEEDERHICWSLTEKRSIVLPSETFNAIEIDPQ